MHFFIQIKGDGNDVSKITDNFSFIVLNALNYSRVAYWVGSTTIS